MNWMEFSPLAGFVYLVVLLSARILLLGKREVRIVSGTGKRMKLQGLMYFIFVLMLLLWLFGLIRHAFQLQINILPPVLNNLYIENILLKIAGNFIVVLALVFFTITLIHFEDSLRFGLNENNKGKLITNGVFSVSRNPFFLSIDLYFFGTAILFPTLFFFIYAVLALISIHFFILKEEKFLLKIYGDEYRRYSEKVGRYFSF